MGGANFEDGVGDVAGQRLQHPETQAPVSGGWRGVTGEG